MEHSLADRAKVMITGDGLQRLIDALAARSYKVLGPRVRDGAIVYDEIARVSDLPRGWTDRQEAGRYQLQRRDDNALFGFAVGPQSWKRFLHPPIETLWKARNSEGGIAVAAGYENSPKFAFIGVRACEIHAIAIQDRVFCEGTYPDTAYTLRRRDAFVVAVNCGEAGGTCFCVSMQTGPKADSGFDLALTELLEGRGHAFLVEVGSEHGAEVLGQVPHSPASEAQLAAAEAAVAQTASRMGRRLETDGIKDLLQGNLNHPRWDVGRRALSDLRQLHHGVPDLLLHDGRRPQRSYRNVRRADSQMGLLFHHGFLLHPRRQCPTHRSVALPAMDDSQARELDRPVRHVGLRRLRPLHHLVPGGH